MVYRRKVYLKELYILIGLFNFVCKVVIFGCLFFRCFLDIMCYVFGLFGEIDFIFEKLVEIKV